MCRLYSVECKVSRVVKLVECKLRSVECQVWVSSVECGVNVTCSTVPVRILSVCDLSLA